MSKRKPAPERVETPADPASVECAAPECSNRFVPKRSTARYCGTTCRQRAARARRAAEAAAEIDAKSETGDAEHGLVRATRLELEKANAIDTVEGQIALQLARKLVDPDNVSPGLAKELRATLVAAKSPPSPTGDEGETKPPEPEDDEVTRARRAREEARQAAGRT